MTTQLTKKQEKYFFPLGLALPFALVRENIQVYTVSADVALD